MFSSQRIVFLLVFAAVGVVVNHLRTRQIRNATTAMEAVKARSSLKRFRIIWPIIGGLGYFVVIPIMYERTNHSEVYNTLQMIGGYGKVDSFDTDDALHIGGGVFLFILLLMGVLPRHSGEESNLEVSDETKASYLSKHKKFALYLRAFHNDDYSEKKNRYDSFLHRSMMDMCNWSSFSEYYFVNELEKTMAVAAVGMTREIEQPEGACRVYVEDDTWQDDVAEMMERASMVLLLIEDRESCLWELRQTFNMREKTVYIVDDAKTYADIVCKHPQLELPAIPECYAEFEHLLIKWDNDRYVMLPFENTIQCYRRMVSDLCGLPWANNEEGMFESVYNGLQQIWISPDDSPDDIRRRISRLMEAKHQLCPMVYYDFITLTDCHMEDNRMVFRFETDDVNQVQTEQLFSSLGSDELQLADNQALLSVEDYLKMEICFSCSNRSGVNLVEYVANPFFCIFTPSKPRTINNCD